MSTSQRIIKNTLWLYLRMGTSILVNIFTTRILLQALGASDYGLYNVVGGAIAMLGFLTASMSTATQRFISYSEGQGDRDKVKEIFNNALIVHYVVAAVTALLLIIAAVIFFNGVFSIPEGRKSIAIGVYVCMVFSTVFSIIIVPYDALLNAHENMCFYSLAGIADVLFKFIIAFVVWYVDGERLLLYALLMALESWLLRIITKYYCRKKYEVCQHSEILHYFSWPKIKQMTSFAGWNMLNTSSSMISLYGTNVVINHFFGTEVNAALGIATQLAGVLMGVSSNLIKAITPVLVKNEGAENRTVVLEITNKGCKFSFLIFAFFSIPISFYIDNVLELWLHKVPLYASGFCLIMLVSNLLDQISTVLYQTISAGGDIKNFSIAMMVPNVLTIVTTIIMLSHGFQPYWGLFSWLFFRTIIGLFIRIYYSHIKIGLSVHNFLSDVITPIVAVLMLICALDVCVLSFDMNWMVSITLSLLFSIPVLLFVGLNRNERRMLTSFFLRRK